MISFVELREKVKLSGGEKQVKSFKAGKRKDGENDMPDPDDPRFD